MLICAICHVSLFVMCNGGGGGGGICRCDKRTTQPFYVLHKRGGVHYVFIQLFQLKSHLNVLLEMDIKIVFDLFFHE